MATASRRRLAADAWGALLQTHAALVPQLDRAVREDSGLPLAWYDVLLELATADEGRLRMSDLAARVVLSRTRISRVVDELAGAGLVSREQNPADGRSAFAVITRQGRRRFEQAAPGYLEQIERRFAAGLTDDELRTIARALRRTATHDIGTDRPHPSARHTSAKGPGRIGQVLPTPPTGPRT
jgi:DNA-binding MarR family transcriptional regulator